MKFTQEERMFLLSFIASTNLGGSTPELRKYMSLLGERLGFAVEDLKPHQIQFIRGIMEYGEEHVKQELKDNPTDRVILMRSILEKTKKATDELPDTDPRDSK